MVMARVHGIALRLVRELPVGRISVDILTQRARLREREVELSPTEHLPTIADTIVRTSSS